MARLGIRFTTPRGRAARIGLFLVAGLAISALLEQLHRARRRAETSEARLSAILGELPVGVGLLDRRGRFVLANRLMESLAITQGNAADAVRRSRWTCCDPSGQPLDPAMRPGARALRGETVSPGIECRFTDEAGREAWYSVAAVPMRREEGFDGAIVVMQDIDRIKRAAAAM